MGFPGNIFILVKIFVDTKAPLDVFKFTALDNYAGKYTSQTPTVGIHWNLLLIRD